MAKVRGLWLTVALALSLLVPLWFLVAAMGTKFGVLDWRVGFGMMTYGMVKPAVAGLGYAVIVMLLAAAMALIGLVMAVAISPRRGWPVALIALAMPLAGLGYGFQVSQQTKDIPPIHDVSTDLVNPPTFSETVVAARAGVPDGNKLDLLEAALPDDPRFGPLAGKPVVDLHRAAYGDLKTMVTDTPAFDAFTVALDTAETQPGWVVDRNDAATGLIEARATSFWYGFTDDIVIRVRRLPDDSGTTIDMRSVSRVGLSDLGANAKRIRAFMKALNGSLGEAATGG